MNNSDLEELIKLDDLFNFTISGIEEHMQHCTVNPDMIIGALMNISEQLHDIIVNAEERKDATTCAQ